MSAPRTGAGRALPEEVRQALVAVGKAEQWGQVPSGTLKTLLAAIEAEAAELDVPALAEALDGPVWEAWDMESGNCIGDGLTWARARELQDEKGVVVRPEANAIAAAYRAALEASDGGGAE